MGVWGARAAASGSGGGGYGSSAGRSAPAGTYDPTAIYTRGGGDPSYFGQGAGSSQLRRFADVGKLNLNLLDPLAASRAEANYLPVDDAPTGPFDAIGHYFSPSTPGGAVSGILGAIGQTVGGVFGEDVGRGVSQAAQVAGKVVEAPLGIVGGFGLDNIPFVAPVIDGLNSQIEEHSPYIMRDTLAVPKNLGGAFQSLMNLLGMAGRGIERTYAGMQSMRGTLPEDIQKRVDSGELTPDEGLDELVMSGRGFTNDPWHNMAISILTDPTNWATLGVGAVAGAAKGTASIGRVFSQAALREGGVVAKLAGTGGEMGALVDAALAGDTLTARNFSRGTLGEMRRLVNQDLGERIAAGEDIPNKLKLAYSERIGMSALGPVSEEATQNAIFRVANYVARATDPINLLFFGGGKAGERSLEQLQMSASTAVMAAVPKTMSIARLADEIVAGGGDRIMQAAGTWGSNGLQEFVGSEMGSAAMNSGRIPRMGSLNTHESIREILTRGGYSTNVGKYIEGLIEKTKDIRVAGLSKDTKAADGSIIRGQMYDESVRKLAHILGVDPTAVMAKVKTIDAEDAMAIHGFYYYTKGTELHTTVDTALKEAAQNGLLPKGLDPDDMTMITPRTLTNRRVKAIDDAIKANDPEALRAAMEDYDDFGAVSRETVKDHELIDWAKTWLDANREYLPKEIDLFDPVTGALKADVAAIPELAKWASDSRDLSYGLANGMPAEAPLEAQWRVARNANGKMLSARPWLQFWAEGIPAAKRLSRWQSMNLAMFHGIRGERILWNQRRRFITDMGTERAGFVAIPPKLSDRIFKALMYEAQQGRVLPRGMAPDQMMDAVGRVLADARAHNSQWDNLAGRLTERQVVTGFLRAMEGDARLVGATQKITGRIKSSTPGAAANYWGQLSEKLYPLMRFTLNPIFMAMETTEPYILNYMRGIPLPLRRNQTDFQQGLASHNAARQAIFASMDPDGLLAESMEMNALRINGFVEAKQKFGPTTFWGRFKGSKVATSERKASAAGLAFRRQMGDELYEAFHAIDGGKKWAQLEYEYGTVNRAAIADRWLASSLMLQDQRGHAIRLTMDLLNSSSLGERLRFSTDGSRPGDFTYGDVEKLFDDVREWKGAAKRTERGLAPGEALLEDLRNMTPAQWLAEVEEAGLAPRVGRVSNSQALHVWRVANGPSYDEWWKAYRDAIVRNVRDTTAATPGLRAAATRRMRDAAIDNAQAVVAAWAKGKNLTPEEFIRLHSPELPRWAKDAPGTLDAQALTDMRADWAQSVVRRHGGMGETAVASLAGLAYRRSKGVFNESDDAIEATAREGLTDAREYVYVPVSNGGLWNLSEGYRMGVPMTLGHKYGKVGTDPLRAITHYGKANDHVFRIKRDSVLATRSNTKGMKRPGSHDMLLDDDVPLTHDVEVLTERGWVPFEDHIHPPGVQQPVGLGPHRTPAQTAERVKSLSALLHPGHGTGGETFVHGVDYRKFLTEDMAEATEDYTVMGYLPINRYWRGIASGSVVKSDHEIVAMSAELDASIMRGAAPERMIVYRGSGMGEGTASVWDKQVGETISEPGYVSSSTNPKQAEEFIAMSSSRRKLLVIIDVPAGFPMNIIEDTEDEWLMGRNIPLIVTKRKETGAVKGGVVNPRVVLHVTPDTSAMPTLTGLRRDFHGLPPTAVRDEELLRHLAATDPAELRRLAEGANSPAVTQLAEEAIAAAESARPAARDLNVGGRRFGQLTPEQTLADIEDNIDPEILQDYIGMYDDLRNRIEGLAETTAPLDEGLVHGEDAVFNMNNQRLLTSLGALLPTHGGAESVRMLVEVMDELWNSGIKPFLKAAEDATDPVAQTRLFVAQNILRGIKDPMQTPGLSARISDSVDVLLNNESRRSLGRAAQSQPIVATDGAYEAAGFLTPETLDDIDLPGGRALPVEGPPIDVTGTTYVGDLGGTTGARLVEGAGGRKYVEKRGNSVEHIQEESFADDAYTAAGVAVPQQVLLDNGTLKRAEYIEGGVSLAEYEATHSAAEVEAIHAQLREGFAADALLANWDVMGTSGDNILIKDGIAYRIDNGGSLRFRAQGGAKGDRFGASVSEIDRMRTTGSGEGPSYWAMKVFRGVTDNDLRAQVLDLYARREAILAALPPDLRDVVAARLEDMMRRTAGVVPAAPKAGRLVADTINDETHAYLTHHYNEVARLANERGLGGWTNWTAADVAAMAARSRIELGRTPRQGVMAGIRKARQEVYGEVYFPPGHRMAKWNPLLDMLNRPENRAYRHELMKEVGTGFAQDLRDYFGIPLDGVSDKGLGIWGDDAAQPLVPIVSLGPNPQGDTVADVMAATFSQREVWHYTVLDDAEVAGRWDEYDPRITVGFSGEDAQGDAEDVAVALGRKFPAARGATAIEVEPGYWEISIIDREKAFPRINEGAEKGNIDTKRLRAMLDETEQGMGEALESDMATTWGKTYVAGPDILDDGTADWEHYLETTQRKLAERGVTAEKSGHALDRMRTAHESRLEWALSEASPENAGRVRRSEPISTTLEERRGGNVLGTTTPVGASEAFINAFDNADPLTGLHELIHLFSVTGMEDSLRTAVSREWEQHASDVEKAAAILDQRAAVHGSKGAATQLRNRAIAKRNLLKNPDGAPWGPKQEEYFVDLVMDYIDRGVPPSPDLANAFEHFRNWIAATQKERQVRGMPPVKASPNMQARLDRLFSRPGVETVPYSVEDQVFVHATRQVARHSWDDAHRLQYYKKDRSMVERSINHPYIGLYPASYMWGKVLPEMLRFLVLRPFGMTTPFLGLNVAREVGDTVRTQSENDPSFKEFLSNNEDAFMFLSMFFPALPQDIPANVSLPIRRVAEQGLEGQAAYAEGRQPKDIEFARGAQDAIQYAVGPLGTIRTAGDIAGMGGELIRDVFGVGNEDDTTRELLPLR